VRNAENDTDVEYPARPADSSVSILIFFRKKSREKTRRCVMKKKSFRIIVLFAAAVFAMFMIGCTTGAGTSTGGKWDEMNWDVDNWG